MLENIIKSLRIRQQIEVAGFKPTLESMAAKLHSQGYDKTTVAFYNQASVPFAYWIARRHILI